MSDSASNVTTIPYSGPDRRNQPERQKVKFDATINLGHILTFIGFMLAGFGTYATLDKRVVVLEEARANQVRLDALQDQRNVEVVGQLKETLVRLNVQIDRLSDKIDQKRTP